MLHTAAVFAHAQSPISAALQRLQDQLMPCILLVVPLKQSKRSLKDAPGNGNKIVAGPLTRLPVTCQVISPEVTAFIPGNCCDTARYNLSVSLGSSTLSSTLLCLCPFISYWRCLQHNCIRLG